MPVFFFSDIEGSTKLWEQYPDMMGTVLNRHDEILKSTIEEFGGFVVKHTGDGVFAIFEDGDPLRGAITVQSKIFEEDWGNIEHDIRIRIALHSGIAEMRGDDYFGADVNKTSRLLNVGWGGQILITDEVLSCCELPENAETRDHYVHVLKDLNEPIRVYGLIHPDLQLTEFPPLRSLSSHPNNLPLQPTQFIGRKEEIEAISRILDKHTRKILTLTGPGGIGKTRLAIQVAAERANDYADGVCFVPLESLDSSEHVVQSIADSLRLNFHNKIDPKEQLVDFLRGKEILLVIDNFEHVIEASSLISEIFYAAPLVTMLLTSREVLNLHGEWVVEIQGLPIASESQSESLDEEEGAVSLFIESAKRLKPNFDVSDEGMRDIIDICRSVEGIPLGIELAASWIRLRSLTEIADDVRDGLSFLYTRSRDIPERHRSIKAVFDYTWNSLSDSEKRISRNLSVFRGGFTMESARRVAGATPNDISALVEKSVIRKSGEGRFDFHPVLKEFTIVKSDEAGDEKNEIEKLHSEYFADFISEYESDLYGEKQVQAIEDINVDLENIRSGWKRAVWDVDYELIGKYLNPVFVYYDIKCLYKEGVIAFRSVLRSPDKNKDIVFASALSRQAVFEFRLGNPEKARKLCMDSLFISQQIDTVNGMERAFSLALLSYIYFSNGEYPEAKRYNQESFDIYKKIGYEWGIAYCLNNMGRIVRTEGDIEKARENYMRSIKIWERVGDMRSCMVPLSNLGAISRFLGEYDRAKEYYQRCLSLAEEIGNPRLTALSLMHIGNTIRDKLDFYEAYKLYKESLEHIIEIGDKQLKAVCLNNIGSVACDLGSFREAEKLCFESLEIKRELGNRAGIASSLNILGGIYVSLSEYCAAREHLFEALHIAFDINRTFLCIEILANISLLLEKEENPEFALQVLSFIIDDKDSSYLIKREATQLAQTVRPKLHKKISEEVVEALEERGRKMNMKKIVKAVLSQLETDS